MEQHIEAMEWRDKEIITLRSQQTCLLKALWAAVHFIQNEVACEFHWTPERFAVAQAVLDGAVDSMAIEASWRSGKGV